MKQLFVIRASGGSYDDAWESARFVTDDEEKGNKYVEEMNMRRQKAEVYEREINEWLNNWRKNNPAPMTVQPVEKQYERWAPNAKITQQMRDARKRVQDDNARARVEAMKPYLEWNQRAIAAWEDWKTQNYPQDVLEDIKNNLQETFWEIEPIEWLK